MTSGEMQWALFCLVKIATPVLFLKKFFGSRKRTDGRFSFLTKGSIALHVGIF